MSVKCNAGDGLFRSFGGKSGKEYARDGQAPDVKKSWFDMFNLNRQKTPVEEGTYFPFWIVYVASSLQIAESGVNACLEFK